MNAMPGSDQDLYSKECVTKLASRSGRESGEFVVFDRVQKSYDGTTLVVKDLNLAISKGEFLTMLGPSGSGKTTCLMMLAGFETATHGEIRLSGRDINLVPPHKRGIGMVFQSYALFPHMTVAENLSFPLEVRSIPKAEREATIKRTLDMVKMGAFANRRPAQLSGGQQQRIALARALVFDPALVLMDEPLGALDKHLREHMQFEIKRLHERIGITVVYVTHDQSEALTMSDRVAVFNDGRIQQLAAPSDIYERPDNSFVAQFIGANNSLPGVVENLSGGRALVRLKTGELISATAVGVTEKGQETSISIRPERVEFKPELMPADAHTLEALVIETVYMGDILHCRVKAAGTDNFIVKMRNTLGQTKLSAGDRIRIGWHPEDARALDPA
ncbi:ABC transporter ATP-binding protein [Rhizobium sp. BK068]|uniref:ABC transporter ATP-binding protein n=1 Tax=Rhizobium sp. BK068 TaxID=2512130 RepID=UPI0010DD524A|nr:ABC transporter ATP-binding protein [Rhizobium sp. BK068]TCM74955.1 putative spermidine/putrescine transport system ATP-binding protein [Rhizobium sp. BK068]